MRASGLRRITIVLVSLMVSACAGLRPNADPMNVAGSSTATMSRSTVAPLNSDLPFARNFDVALRQAQDLRKRGDLNQASRILAQLVLASPDDPRVVGEYGKVMLESGSTDDAVAFLERAVTLQPTDWTLYSALGVAYDQSDKREQARAAFSRALTIKPGEPTVLSNLAVSHLQAGELDEAERLLVQASEQKKDLPGIADRLAMVRNIRSTTSTQNRPLTVSALPQPLAPTTNSAPELPPAPVAPTESAAPALISPPIETAPAPALTPVSQEPVDEEEPDVIEEPETENVAVVPPPAPAVAASEQMKSSTINTVQASSKISPQRQTPRAASAQRVVKVSANTTAVPRTTPKPAVQAPKPADIQAPARNPAPAQVAAVPSKAPAAPVVAPAITPPPAAIVATAPQAAEPAVTPSPQSALMTRPAGVTNPSNRTGGTPLILAPPRESWESMVRVSTPQSSAAVPNATEQPAQEVASEPPPEPATWGGMFMRWVSVAFGFVTSFWA